METVQHKNISRNSPAIVEMQVGKVHHMCEKIKEKSSQYRHFQSFVLKCPYWLNILYWNMYLRGGRRKTKATAAAAAIGIRPEGGKDT